MHFGVISYLIFWTANVFMASLLSARWVWWAIVTVVEDPQGPMHLVTGVAGEAGHSAGVEVDVGRDRFAVGGLVQAFVFIVNPCAVAGGASQVHWRNLLELVLVQKATFMQIWPAYVTLTTGRVALVAVIVKGNH